MNDFIIDIDGDDGVQADSKHNAEDIIIGMLNEGTCLSDITVSIIVRERLQFEVTGVRIVLLETMAVK